MTFDTCQWFIELKRHKRLPQRTLQYLVKIPKGGTLPHPLGNTIMRWNKLIFLCYLFHRWHMFPPPKDIILLALSSSACEMLLFIKGRLQILQEQLASSIFNTIWKNLAQALNKCIYEEVGILQLFR